MRNDHRTVRTGFRRAKEALLAILMAGLVLTGCGSGASQTLSEDAASSEEAAAKESTGASDSGEPQIFLSEDGETTYVEIGGTVYQADPEADAAPELPQEETLEGAAPTVKTDLSGDSVLAVLSLPAAGLEIPVAAQEGTDCWFDVNNSTDFIDPDTVLHGSLAGALKGIEVYSDQKIFEEQPYLYIDTPSWTIEYRVFAVYEEEIRDLIIEYNPLDYNGFYRYIDDIYSIRGIGVLLDESQREAVEGNWQMLTIQADEGGGRAFLIQANQTAVVTKE